MTEPPKSPQVGIAVSIIHDKSILSGSQLIHIVFVFQNSSYDGTSVSNATENICTTSQST